MLRGNSSRFVVVGTVSMLLWVGCQAPPGHPEVVQVEGVRNVTQADNVYIAGRPTAEGLRAMKARGVTTVIDLRRAAELEPDESAVAESIGLTRVHVPMGSDGITDEQAESFLDAMKKHAGGGVLIHCGGANRAGAMYGLYLGATGKCDADEAVQRAKAAGMRSAGLETGLRSQLGSD